MTNEAGERTVAQRVFAVRDELMALAYTDDDNPLNDTLERLGDTLSFIGRDLNDLEQEIASLRAKGELADEAAVLLAVRHLPAVDLTANFIWLSRYDSLTKSEEAKG